MAKALYNTREAARKMGVSFRTLNRWISQGRIKSSHGVPMGAGRTLWLWTDRDIAKGRKLSLTLVPGPKPKAGKR
jgi:hypothetical protein